MKMLSLQPDAETHGKLTSMIGAMARFGLTEQVADAVLGGSKKKSAS